MSRRDLPLPQRRRLLRDLAKALDQQMFFWGRDVMQSCGNLLIAYGFERYAKKTEFGTSQYRIRLAGGIVELHGNHAGYFGFDTCGMLYIRNAGACHAYRGSTPPAEAGTYPPGLIGPPTSVESFEASLRFVRWWVAYERWVSETMGDAYRESCFQAFCRLKARRWLPALYGLRWLPDFADRPHSARRATCIRRTDHS
ncbi:MAG: hypothetical protein R3F11_06055 [Verrucomicrobiales bacterium]